jgi:hypothetical protein
MEQRRAIASEIEFANHGLAERACTEMRVHSQRDCRADVLLNVMGVAREQKFQSPGMQMAGAQRWRSAVKPILAVPRGPIGKCSRCLAPRLGHLTKLQEAVCAVSAADGLLHRLTTTIDPARDRAAGSIAQLEGADDDLSATPNEFARRVHPPAQFCHPCDVCDAVRDALGIRLQSLTTEMTAQDVFVPIGQLTQASEE